MGENLVLNALFTTLNIPLRLLGYSSAMSLLAFLTLNWVEMDRYKDKLESFSETKTHFDFIVVGGGSAGAVVAYRLSESGKHSVLLLEAGGTPPPFTSFPMLAIFNCNLDTDWKYKTVAQRNSCYAMKKQKMPWSRGKLLGGTSNLNWMIYVRGHPMDFNQWAEISEDKQWTYKNLLPFFKKMENYHGNFGKRKKYHGTKGPLYISKHQSPPLISTWLAAGRELGFQTKSDYNGYQELGFYPLEVTIQEGRRAGTFASYIELAREHKNLKIYPFSHVTKIKIDAVTMRATGVIYQRHGETKEAFAKQEIIISAGAIGTPQLLMLSGIGPAVHLKSVGIRPKVNLPGVGHNLQDHVQTAMYPFVFNDSVSFQCKRNLTLESVMDYELNKTGFVAQNLISGIAFINTSHSVPLPGKGAWPNVALIFAPIGLSDDEDAQTFSKFLGIDQDLAVKYAKPFLEKDTAWVFITVALPKSRGTITLESDDPFDHPNIDPNYFDHPEDIKVLVEGMKFVVKLFEKTKAWQKFDAKFSPEHKLARCKKYSEKSDEYFECYARTLTLTQWHPCCTARFGKVGDPMAVLNSNLRQKYKICTKIGTARHCLFKNPLQEGAEWHDLEVNVGSVIGVKGLRVADASAMPVITNGNINAPCIMLGERVSQLILDDWERKEESSEEDENNTNTNVNGSPLDDIAASLGWLPAIIEDFMKPA